MLARFTPSTNISPGALLARSTDDFSVLGHFFKKGNYPWNYDLNTALDTVLLKTSISLSQIGDKNIFPNPSISMFYDLLPVFPVFGVSVTLKQEAYGYVYLLFLCNIF